MLAWLAPVLVFGLVVFVHELGHFVAAKIFGVYAPRFSIGFGPAIAKWRRGETEYRIGILPLGGYVRMASRLDEAAASLEGGVEAPPDGMAADPDAMIPFGPKPVPEDRWFESKSLGARLAIMLAGVTMNMLLGLVINIGLVKTYGHDVTTRVSEVLPGKPAVLAGMQAGDSIASINGVPVTAWDSLVDQVSRARGVPLSFGVIRDGKPVALTITPAVDTATDRATGKPDTVGRIGAAPSLDERPVPIGRAVVGGVKATGDMGMLVFTSLKMIANRTAPVSDLGGPIAIAQTSVQAARQGGQVLFYLIALLSVNLAVFNLLPVPLLDGGQIVVLIVEAIRGRVLSDRARENIARVGLALILLLFITLTFNDIKRILVGVVGGHAG
jgi:regulator of sigma E protease